jgi:hypothetical protein
MNRKNMRDKFTRFFFRGEKTALNGTGTDGHTGCNQKGHSHLRPGMSGDQHHFMIDKGVTDRDLKTGNKAAGAGHNNTPKGKGTK